MKKTEPALWGADRKVCDDAAQYPEYTLGRILSQEKDLYRMITAEGEYLAKVSGKFRYQAAHPSDFPAVGDFVMAGKTGEGTQAVIHQVLPRKSVFMRKAAGSDRKELLFLPDGGMVIDTPGMRELGMWDAKSGIDRTFLDIEELVLQCRFRDCTHTVEPGCAVQKALKNGTLSKERMQSYQKLKIENDYMEHAKSYLEVKEKKFKEIAKYNKNHYKKQRKNGIYSQ